MLTNLGEIARMQGDYASAQALYEESLALQRELGHQHYIAINLFNLGQMARRAGDYAQAQRLLTESLELDRQIGLKAPGSGAELARLAADVGNYAQARRWFEESLRTHHEIGQPLHIAEDLEALAHLARQQSDWQRATRLWATVQTLRAVIGSPLSPDAREDYVRDVAAVREALGEEAFAAAWAEGRAMTLG